MNPIFALLLFAFLANMHGTWSYVTLILLGVGMFVMFAVYLVMNQETVLYVPQPVRGMQVPADNPRGMRSPKDKNMSYEDVQLETSDGERLHAWWIPAPGCTLRHPWTEYTITLEREDGEALGLCWDNDMLENGVIVVQALEEDGAAARWNSTNPDRGIRARDAIVEVNGVRTAVEALLEEVNNKDATLAITFRRAKTPTYLFCHENAGNIGFRVPNFAQIQEHLQANILALDYRGYGHSTGTPSEDGLIEDALCAWRWLKAKAESGCIDGQQLFVYGRSLGGAVGIGLAATLQKQGESEPQGLIVENTFVSISAIVDTMFPFLAFQSLKDRVLRLRWESGERIKDLTLPLLFLAGEKDEMIPPVQMRQLVAAAQSARIRKSATFPDGTHNDTWERGGERYWEEQLNFMKECCRAGGASSEASEAKGLN